MSLEDADIALRSPKMFATRLRNNPYWQSSPSYNGLYQRIDFRTFPKPFSRKAIWSYRRESIVKFTAARNFHTLATVFVIYMIKQYSPVGTRVTICTSPSSFLFSVYWNTSDSITPRNEYVSHVEQRQPRVRRAPRYYYYVCRVVRLFTSYT